MAKPKRYEMIRGPLDGARFPVPKGNRVVCVAIGKRVHFYEMATSLMGAKPRMVLLHTAYAAKGG